MYVEELTSAQAPVPCITDDPEAACPDLWPRSISPWFVL